MADGTEGLIEEMFVQVATGVSAGDAELVLHGVSPSTLYFSDRPQRVVGHLTTQQFVAQWGDGDNSFASDPPNAVVSTFSNDERHLEAVAVFRDPALSDDTLTYRADVLEGGFPVTGAPARSSSIPTTTALARLHHGRPTPSGPASTPPVLTRTPAAATSGRAGRAVTDRTGTTE